MPPFLTKDERIVAFNKDKGSIDDRLRNHNLSRTMMRLCKETGCERSRQHCSSRCEAHAKK
jgi:hypothetical protein